MYEAILQICGVAAMALGCFVLCLLWMRPIDSEETSRILERAPKRRGEELVDVDCGAITSIFAMLLILLGSILLASA